MTCQHVPPSPGQDLCQCGHHQIEMQYALAFMDRSEEEAWQRGYEAGWSDGYSTRAHDIAFNHAHEQEQ